MSFFCLLMSYSSSISAMRGPILKPWICHVEKCPKSVKRRKKIFFGQNWKNEGGGSRSETGKLATFSENFKIFEPANEKFWKFPFFRFHESEVWPSQFFFQSDAQATLKWSLKFENQKSEKSFITPPPSNSMYQIRRVIPRM